MVEGLVEQLRNFQLVFFSSEEFEFISSYYNPTTVHHFLASLSNFFLFRSASFNLECVNSHLEFPPLLVSTMKFFFLFMSILLHSFCPLKSKSKSLLFKVMLRLHGWDYVPTAAKLRGDMPHKKGL